MNTLKQGFSLIELLVVIAIIGVLAAVGTTGYQSYLDSAKLAANKANSSTLVSAIKNEDAAQQASAGAYTDCTATTLEACVTAILADSTMRNPYTDDAYVVDTDMFVVIATPVATICPTDGAVTVYLNTTDSEVTPYYCTDDSDDTPVAGTAQSVGWFTGLAASS